MRFTLYPSRLGSSESVTPRRFLLLLLHREQSRSIVSKMRLACVSDCMNCMAARKSRSGCILIVVLLSGRSTPDHEDRSHPNENRCRISKNEETFMPRIIFLLSP